MVASNGLTGVERTFPDDQVLISATDLRGIVAYANKNFVDISGYTHDELKGSPHNLVRHPDMPKQAFKDLWTSVKKGEPWMGIVQNRCKNGDHYWVDAYVTPIFEGTQVKGYQSVRSKPDRKTQEQAAKLYAEIQKPVSWYKRIKLSFMQKLFTGFVAAMLPVLVALLFFPASGLLVTVPAVLLSLAAAYGVIVWLYRPYREAAERARSIFDNSIACSVYTGRDDELGQMELTIKALQAEIRTILSRIGESSEQLSTIANGNGKVVEATNQAVKQQQSGIEEVSTAMHEMAVTVDEVSGNTRRSAEAAQSADKEVEEGRQVVSETAVTIQNLSEQIEHASDVIKQLDDESKAIGSVIDVINELAFQTNLLALNASIEAARAGQHGNGFAVVAAEVRSLASRTKDSTEIIQNSVHQLQTSTKEAVDIMALGRDKAQASVMQADRAGQSLASIGEAVETIRTMTVQIASALDEQGTVAAAMDRNIADIRESAEETASTSSSMAETSVRLATQVENMKAMVLQFSETGS